MSHILNLGMNHVVSYTRFRYKGKSINTATLPWFESVRKSQEGESVTKLRSEQLGNLDSLHTACLGLI
jgi:alpha-galactosidase/6-phospho-beta-glucosidase family protein